MQPCLAAGKRARTGSRPDEPSPWCPSSPKPPASQRGDGVAARRGQCRYRSGATAWLRGGDGAGIAAGHEGCLLPRGEGSVTACSCPLRARLNLF